MQLEVGTIVEGKVTAITKFGAFVELPGAKTGMVHISEVAAAYVKEIRDYVTENQTVKVKVLSIGEDGKISLSMKRALPPPPAPAPRPAQRPQQRSGGGRSFSQGREWSAPKSSEPQSFEDMLSKFKQSSDEKMSDLKRSNEGKRGSYNRRSGGGKV